MFSIYVAVTVLAAAANAAAAAFDFARSELVIDNMATLGIPRAWLFPLGALKAAGALGLLVGIGVPLLGVAAAAGLVLFFVGAVYTHVHAGDYSAQFGGAVGFLVLAVAALVLGLAAR